MGPWFGKEGIKDPDGVFRNYGPASIETEGIAFGCDIF